MGKKLLTVLLALCMVLSLAACSNPNKTTEAGSSSSAETTQEPSTEEPTTETETIWQPGPEDFSYLTDDNGFITGITAGNLIDLPDFSTISFSRETYASTDDEVETEIETFLSSVATKIEDESYVVQKGDILIADYVGKFDGEAFSGGTASNVEIEAGGVGYIDDFQDQLIGHHVGEVFDIEVTFPVPYTNNPDYAGKDAVFTITIHSVKVTPELTDEFVETHQDEITAYFATGDTEVKTADDLRTYIRDSITEYKINEAISEYAYSLTLKEYPEAVQQVGRKLVELAFYMSYGIDIKTYQSALGYSDEDMDNFIRTEVTPVVFYQAIAEKEGWEITEADFKDVTGTEENDKFIEYYGKGYIARVVIENRALQYMKEHCDIH